jgi:hypothetical protein
LKPLEGNLREEEKKQGRILFIQIKNARKIIIYFNLQFDYFFKLFRNEIIKVKTRMAKIVLDKNKSGNEENCDPRLDKGVKENYCNSNF